MKKQIQISLNPEEDQELTSAAQMVRCYDESVQTRRRIIVKEAIHAVCQAIIKEGKVPWPMKVAFEWPQNVTELPIGQIGWFGLYKAERDAELGSKLEWVLRRMKPADRDRAMRIITATLSRFFPRSFDPTKQKARADFATIKAGRCIQPVGTGNPQSESPSPQSVTAAPAESSQLELSLGVDLSERAPAQPKIAREILAWGARLAVEMGERGLGCKVWN